MFVKSHCWKKVSTELIKCEYDECECDFDIHFIYLGQEKL